MLTKLTTPGKLGVIAFLIGMLTLTGVPTLLAAPAQVAEPKLSGVVRVAFIGDQRLASLGDSSLPVLQLIRDEGADMVLHQGDFS